MNGRFIHIHYFVHRDESGEYKGTIEVCQDVTEIRQLKGERRLLGTSDYSIPCVKRHSWRNAGRG